MAIASKTYDAIVAQRLRPLIEAQNWTKLTESLDSLSNAQFRTAGNMLGGRLSETMPDETFWAMFTALISHNARAFLGTMLKQVCTRVENGTLSLSTEEAHQALQQLQSNPVDVQKTLAALLPLMPTPEDVETLFVQLGVTDNEERIAPLLRINTLPALYMLVQALRYKDHDRDFLIRTAYFLIKRGDGMSFNLASLLCSYFGLDEVKGTFSLQLAPYQLARITESYDAFVKTINT